jgi:membrane protein implicated in regulation of membrane protease activity
MKNVGQVMIQGQIWSARTDDDSTILEGNRVIVKDIKGVKLIVSSMN